MPHTKRIDIVYLNEVHGMSVNKIAKSFGHHYVTINNILNLYKSQGRTSIPHNTYCPVSKQDKASNEVQILDLAVLKMQKDEEIFNDENL